MSDIDWDQYDKYHSRGLEAALSDFKRKFDYRLTDEFRNGENEYFQSGYRQGWTYAVREDVESRYPGYDNPNSMPPEWFDPADAGEEW